MDNQFLLDTQQARTLYDTYAAPCPIIDYHSHLDPEQIASNATFANITQAWLYGDHYKWRALRTCGVAERFITGDATDREKFDAWAAVVPKLLMNPLYHWTHLELKRIFGLDVLLSPATADLVWERTLELLQTPGFGAADLLMRQDVEVVCTTDDPASAARYAEIINHGKTLRMYPAWRPERAMAIGRTEAFRAYVATLAERAACEIKTFDDFCEALQKRHAYFETLHCYLSDYSVEAFAQEPMDTGAMAALFARVLAGGTATEEEAVAFASGMLLWFATLDARAGWVRQMHIGALRNPNRAQFHRLGADTGFDAMNDFNYAKPLAAHLSTLAEANALPRTILYNLNPKDSAMMAVLCGSFQDGTAGGKMHYGAAWWFLDQMDGMREQLRTLGQLGCLSQFVGMLTDSRSVLSVPRHEYFRRTLCQWLGEQMARGIVPDDEALVGAMVRGMCYDNAKRLFGL